MQKRSVALSQDSIRTTARFFYLGKDTRIKQNAPPGSAEYHISD
jgi:hypothetical protein